MRALALTVAAIIGLALPAFAHGLVVFAYAEQGEVVVEAKFSTGKLPALGSVQVYDADDALIAGFDLGDTGELRFPIDPETMGDGIRVEVTTGEGHDNYWILTPDDLTGQGDKS